MALVNCQECGKEISSKAFSYPNCGCPTDNGLDSYSLELKNQTLLENQVCELFTIRSTLKFFQVLVVIGILGSILFILFPLLHDILTTHVRTSQL
jgi:hypothetical protein